jgi:protein SCO1/2
MMRILKRTIDPIPYFLIALIALFTLSCARSESKADPADAKHYPFKGKVVSIDKAAKKAKIDHDAVPGYMEAMTMDFPIKEDWVWNELTPGSEIRADLVVSKDDYWLEKIGIIAAPDPNQPAPPINESFAQIGKEVPNFTLTDQDGKKISLKDFRGKALAITFIYRECPLPDYCIRMSQNFSDLANRFKNDPEAKDRIRLLSISFDPERDTPEKLKQYGIGYLGNSSPPDFSIWQLAVGSDQEVRAIADFFGLQYEVDPENKTQFNHSLRTAVIGPSGKVTKIFPGNDWTPGDLARELKSAAANG